jgi:hypothetical protein
MPSPSGWIGSAAAATVEWVDRRLESLGRLTLLAGAAITGVLGLWIVLSGVPTVRGVDLNVILTIQKALHGQPLYTDTAAPPFDIGQYSPIFYLLTIAITRILGIGGDSPLPLLVLGRSISVLSTAASGVLLVRFGVRSLGLPRGLAVGAFAFSLVATAPWLFLARPDSLALFITLGAFVLMARSVIGDRDLAMTVATAVVAVVALFTKQSAIQILPIAVFFYLLLGRWTQAAIFTGVFGAGAAAAWALAMRRWPYFAANVIGGVDNGISLFNAFDHTYAEFFPLYAPVLAVALLALTRWVRRPLTWDGAFFLSVLSGLLGVATVTALKQGSAANYYNEFLFIASLAAARLLHQGQPTVGSAANASAWLSPSRLAAAFFICWLPFHVLMEVRDSWWKRIDPRVSLVVPMFSLWSPDYDQLRAIADAEASGDRARWVLAFPLAANAALPSHMLVPQKEIAQLLFARQVVDYGAFQQLVARDELALIVTWAAESHPPPSFLGAPMPPVTPVAVVGAYRVFRVLPGGASAPLR